MRQYTTPSGKTFDLFTDMLSRPHLLIAGATGTGKSVLINGLLYTALYKLPSQTQFILLDPKQVELSAFQRVPHCIAYSDNNRTMQKALELSVTMIEKRFSTMKRRGLKKFDGSHVYVVIDELADLLTTNKKAVEPLIQRIGQIGRAAKIGLLVATQRPTNDVISPRITVNLDCRVGLRTINRQQSRNIIGMSGCELLPDPLTAGRAQCYYLHNSSCEKWNLPYIPEFEIDRLIEYWN